jgi:hypothetical protein
MGADKVMDDKVMDNKDVKVDEWECAPKCWGVDDEGKKWTCEKCGACLDDDDKTKCDDDLLTTCATMCDECLECAVMSTPCGADCAANECDECLGCVDGNDSTDCPDRCEEDCMPCGECLEDHYGDKKDGKGDDKKDHTKTNGDDKKDHTKAKKKMTEDVKDKVAKAGKKKAGGQKP